MKRTTLAASITLVIMLIFATVATARRHCAKLFTVRMGERAANAVYTGTGKVTLEQLRLLGYIERCQRNPLAQPFVRNYDRHQAAVRQERILQASMSYAEASWYDDSGATASGWHAYYGVANRSLSFGTQVTFFYGGRSVTAVVDDRGPYVGGRDWDLNQNTAAALGFGGIGTVGYILR